MKFKIVFFLLTISCLYAYAQQEGIPTTFTLIEAQEYALKNGYNARNNELDVKNAQHKIKEILGMGLPQINAEAQFQNFLELPVNVITMPDPITGKMVRQELRFGTDYTMNGSITATQLIFDGTYFLGVQASKIYADIAKFNKEKQAIEIKQEIANSYYLVLTLMENQKITDSSLVKLKKISFETNELYKSGFLEEADADQLNLLVAKTQNASNQIKRQVEIAKNLLKFQMGIPIENPIELTDKIEQFINPKENFAVPDNLDITTHIDYQVMTKQVIFTKMALKKERIAYFPSLAAFYNYQRNSYSNDFNFFSSSATWFPTSVWGLKLKVPIFDGLSKHYKIQQAKLDYLKTTTKQKQLEESLKLNYQQAKIEYQNAYEKYLTTKDNLKLSEKIKNTTIIKYKEGLSTSLNLTQIENQFLETQAAYISALNDLLLKKVALEKAMSQY